jgi:hypothetical protein
LTSRPETTGRSPAKTSKNYSLMLQVSFDRTLGVLLASKLFYGLLVIVHEIPPGDSMGKAGALTAFSSPIVAIGCAVVLINGPGHVRFQPGDASIWGLLFHLP